MTRALLLAGAAVLAMAGAAWAAEPPMDHSSMPPGMNHGAPSPMAAMPAVYGGQADKVGAPVFTGLGAHQHRISTRNAEAQRFFNQGVNLLFGFNHAEAIRSFREAARLDPKCAMCWWGVAFALGPNINLPMQPDANAPALEALAKAQALKPRASRAERAWIDALAARYSADPKAERPALDEAFAAAMGKLVKTYPDDLDAATFWAESMMDTQPWNYWEPDGVTSRGHGADIVAVLEKVIAKAPNHPGALHLYIHAVEASTTPERAEAAADRLLTLMPQAGHIVHMPSHIFYRVGRYRDAAKANEDAALVDEAYIAACKAQGFYPAGYYGHNLHFLWTSSEMEGREGASMSAARRLVKAVNAVEMAPALPPMEPFVATPMVTMLRFGRWDALLAEPAPPPSLIIATAEWHYARGFAFAAKGDLAAARAERAAIAPLLASDFAKYEPFGVPGKGLTELSLTMLDGEIARASGDLPGAIATFRKAADMERALPYSEPAYWHQPVGHVLGAALLQANRPAEAEAAYRESLKVYRRDGWALYGLAQALAAQGKTAEAAAARAEFEKAWALADVKLAASRF